MYQVKHIQLLVAYDGTEFFGWQKTSMGPTIEETLEKVLQQILQERVLLQAASRTDRGVHAEGQVVTFFTSRKSLALPVFLASLNALLPPSITVLAATHIPPSFHPSLDAEGKQYHYFLCNTRFQKPQHRLFSWHVPYTLDITAMEQAIPHLLGTHDFSAFCNTEGLTPHKAMCTLNALTLTSLGEGRWVFSVQGNRFLFRMVRILVGTLVLIGRGKLSQEMVPALFISKKRSEAGMTAPPHGLVLTQVYYKKHQQDILPREQIKEEALVW